MQEPTARPRIEDVARRAGVSPKTVSRVLNGERYVREPIRERVWEAVRALRYSPHPSARSLAANRSFEIALVYDNPSPSYVMEVLAGVLASCARHRYRAIVQPIDSSAATAADEIEALITSHRVDGLLLTPPVTDTASIMARLEEKGVPVACISPRERERCIGAALDERRAAREIVDHLIALGHRRIAHIVGHPRHGASGWRLEGYRQSLAAAGIAADPALIVPGEFSFESGMAAAARLLALPQPPTAIFAANDDMAAGALRTAAERGVAVPRQLSVCGFDDTPISRQTWPPLTTVYQPCRLLGETAAEQLIRRIGGDATAAMRALPFELKLRASTAPPPTVADRALTVAP